jgi:hypothetical protein
MSYPCEIIKDLLPLYVDEVCSEESRAAVAAHLAECGACRECYAAMLAADGVPDGVNAGENENSEDVKMVDSLKSVKKRLNRRTKMIIGAAFVIVAVFFLGFQVLFSMPLKSVDVSDVSVTAKVYSLKEMAEAAGESGGENEGSTEVLLISNGEDDESPVVSINLDGIAEFRLTQDVLDEEEYATVITWSSRYFLREIAEDYSKESGSDVVYVTDIKTTFLNNKAADYNRTMSSVDFREINKIVYVGKNGAEQVLWENTGADE